MFKEETEEKTREIVGDVGNQLIYTRPKAERRKIDSTHVAMLNDEVLSHYFRFKRFIEGLNCPQISLDGNDFRTPVQ